MASNIRIIYGFVYKFLSQLALDYIRLIILPFISFFHLMSFNSLHI
jgi:hypothetical protein